MKRKEEITKKALELDTTNDINEFTHNTILTRKSTKNLPNIQIF